MHEWNSFSNARSQWCTGQPVWTPEHLLTPLACDTAAKGIKASIYSMNPSLSLSLSPCYGWALGFRLSKHLVMVMEGWYVLELIFTLLSGSVHVRLTWQLEQMLWASHDHLKGFTCELMKSSLRLTRRPARVSCASDQRRRRRWHPSGYTQNILKSHLI